MAAFLVASAVLVTAAVVTAGALTSAFFERHVHQEEQTQTAEIVQNQARQHLTAAAFASPGDPAAGSVFQTFLEGLPRVFRIKAFDPTGRIVWSDEPRLIGQRFEDNPYLQAALAGRVTTVLGPPRRREHVYERDHTWIGEVYVPIVLPGNPAPVGVVETYRDMTAPMTALERTQRLIWVIGGGLGAVLYLALVAVVWQASASEQRAVRALEARNRELAQVQRFSTSLLGPLDPSRLAQAVTENAGSAARLARAALYRHEADGRLVRLAAWPEHAPPLEVPAAAAAEALARGAPIQTADLLVVALSTPEATAHVFVGQPTGRRGPGDALAQRPLQIMLHEAAIALANVQLFTEIRQAHERLAAILAGIVDRLVIVDRSLRVVWMNDAARAAMGPDLVGRTCFEVMGVNPEMCEGCPAMRTLQSGQVERGVRAETSASGRTTYLDLITAPLRDASGQVTQVLEVSRDITELVAMEERLKQANQALLDAQAQLIEKERLAAVGQLVVGLHHAILNPLTGILGAIQLVKQGDLDAGVRATALAAAEEEVRKLESLVKRLPEIRRADDTPYVGGTTMLDLERACEGESPPDADARRS